MPAVLTSTRSCRERKHFTPVYDADGNQTRIRTSTGIWEISYDANDRPIVFTSQDGRTTSPAATEKARKGHRQWGVSSIAGSRTRTIE
ncbi:MAG: hypothetical protein ACLT8E_01265 [Akkermansia sp.]